MNVIKRSGEEVSFDADKILLAIEKANQATQENRQISEDKILKSQIASFRSVMKLHVVFLWKKFRILLKMN